MRPKGLPFSESCDRHFAEFLVTRNPPATKPALVDGDANKKNSMYIHALGGIPTHSHIVQTTEGITRPRVLVRRLFFCGAAGRIATWRTIG